MKSFIREVFVVLPPFLDEETKAYRGNIAKFRSWPFKSVLANRTSCDDGNVLYLLCLVLDP